MTTYMFPGQGSQVKGMGSDLFSRFPEEVRQADEILGYSIENLCVNDPQEQLNHTQYTQPALFMIEAFAWLARDQSVKADFCIGHSLGEYSALYAAGCFNLVTGLTLVKKRGELMAKARGGAMLAVINLSPERILTMIQGINGIDIANYNSSKQIVLSGPPADINRASEILSKEALMCVPLPVAGAFHSRYMQDAANEFKLFLNDFSFSEPKIPVISNATVEPYSQETLKDLLVRQVSHPVRWSDTIRYLRGQGESQFVEMGPGNVLTRLMAQNPA